MCACNKNRNTRLKNFNTSPTQNKVVSSKVTRGNIYQGLQNKNNQTSPAIPPNQNKINKNSELIRRALLEKNRNKKSFK